jgi:hypothetical protein
VAVAFDAASESHTETTGSVNEASFTWEHDPVAAPQGVVVFTWVVSTVTDLATAVTYEDVALTAVPGAFAADSVTEIGNCKAWILGSGVPTADTATVVVTRTNTANTMYAACFTLTAAGAVQATGVQIEQENQALTEVSVDDGSPGTNSLRLAVVMFGDADLPVVGANSTQGPSIDIGARTCSTVRETTPGQGSRPVGWDTGAISDDVAAVYLAVREVAAIGLSNETDASLATALVKYTTTGTAAEIDSGISRALSKLFATGQGAETDAALGSSLQKLRPVGVSAESDTALALNLSGPLSVGRSDELDAALGLVPRKVATTGQSVESDSALAIALSKRVAIGLATEVDSALALVAPLVVGRANEIDEAIECVLSIMAAPATQSRPRRLGRSLVADTGIMGALAAERERRRRLFGG